MTWAVTPTDVGPSRRRSPEGEAETLGASPPGEINAMRARFDDLGPGGSSFVLCDPSEVFVARGCGDVAAVLRAAERAAERGRWVAGFVSYEAAASLDPTLPAVGWPAGHPMSALPLAWFAAFERHEKVEPCRPAVCDGDGTVWTLDRDQAWHRAAVEDIHEAIAAGDYYQLNLTARLTGAVDDPDALYAGLAAAQAGRYNALVVTGEHTIVSASPELYFTREGEEVVTRPMKGTAARGRWPAEDQERARSLRSSAKERAENVMIVDLLRNDLGRLAEVGTVDVRALFETERYPTVWQLTSTIAARVSAQRDLAELFGALFPSGSITGAPKRAAMRAIAGIEQRPRGVYCGAIGYLRPASPAASGPVAGPPPKGRRPDSRFSVAIRTITVVNGSGYAEYGSGGAITSSSDADAEWSELITKTAVLRLPPRPRQLLETLRFEPPDTLVNFDRHLARIVASADYFDFGCDPAVIRAAVSAAVDEREDTGRVRILLEPSGEIRVEVGVLGPTPRVARVGMADRPVDSSDVLLFHKHSERASYDRFRQSRPDLDDVVLWNEHHQVTETTIANLAVHLGGRWWTPALAGGLLPGIERGRLIDDGTLTERVITSSELASADDLALVSSLRGWRRATLVA